MINVGNKKGFTLIELLSVIILIGLVFGISVFRINKIKEKMNKKSLNTKLQLIESAAILW